MGWGASDRAVMKQGVTQHWLVCTRERCNVMHAGCGSAAWPEWTAKGQRSPAPRPGSATQGMHLTGLKKPGSSASSPSGSQGDSASPSPPRVSVFPSGPSTHEPRLEAQ